MRKVIFFEGFALLEIVPINNFTPIAAGRGRAMYCCEATSVQGFIQQLAVCYVGRGYWFYVAGSVPEGKDPRAIDEKLIARYGIDISKWSRARRKRLGLANLQYIRAGRFFLLLATQGEHPFFVEECGIKDIRRFPVRFHGYSISYRRGRDGKWHPSVRIDELEFKYLKRHFRNLALTTRVDILVAKIAHLQFEPYAPVRNQYRELLRGINRTRQLAALEPVPNEVLPNKRQVVTPFD